MKWRKVFWFGYGKKKWFDSRPTRYIWRKINNNIHNERYKFWKHTTRLVDKIELMWKGCADAPASNTFQYTNRNAYNIVEGAWSACLLPACYKKNIIATLNDEKERERERSNFFILLHYILKSLYPFVYYILYSRKKNNWNQKGLSFFPGKKLPPTPLIRIKIRFSSLLALIPVVSVYYLFYVLKPIILSWCVLKVNFLLIIL